MAGGFHLKNSLHYGVKRILRAVGAPVQLLYQKLFNIFSPDAIVGRVSADVKKEIRSVGKKPDSLKGYYAVGDRYVAKKLVYVPYFVGAGDGVAEGMYFRGSSPAFS